MLVAPWVCEICVFTIFCRTNGRVALLLLRIRHLVWHTLGHRRTQYVCHVANSLIYILVGGRYLYDCHDYILSGRHDTYMPGEFVGECFTPGKVTDLYRSYACGYRSARHTYMLEYGHGVGITMACFWPFVRYAILFTSILYALVPCATHWIFIPFFHWCVFMVSRWCATCCVVRFKKIVLVLFCNFYNVLQKGGSSIDRDPSVCKPDRALAHTWRMTQPFTRFPL